MAKVRLEKIAGIVALSYLVLIPMAGAVLFQKTRLMQDDLDDMYERLGLPPRAEDTVDVMFGKVRRLFRR